MSTSKDILEDANLDQIEIGADGKSVTLTFLDMAEGKSILTLRCGGVLILEYQNAFLENDGLAVYVGHVSVEKVSQGRAKSRLLQRNYCFSSDVDSGWPHMESCFSVDVEGGEVLIRILCQTLTAEPPILPS